MELKSYQKEVIADLARYLELVVELQSPAKAYQALWNKKNVLVGFGGMPNYVNVLPGVPHVCAKVPTGGGKTYIAASSLRTIFDAMPQRRAKAVVWLVPSEAILTQTRKALENPDHPYRQRLDVDFGGRVQVYSKEQALMGQNFTPSAVTEQLSLFVLSYDSFRTSKKEGRKAYQENGYLAEFAKWMDDPSGNLRPMCMVMPLPFAPSWKHRLSETRKPVGAIFVPSFCSRHSPATMRTAPHTKKSRKRWWMAAFPKRKSPSKPAIRTS